MLQKTDHECNLHQVYEVLIRQWPDPLLRNPCNCVLKILQFDLCLVSEIFSFFHVLCLILLVMGVDLLQFLGIWFIKATTEESFSLTRTKPTSLQEGIGLIMQTVVSQRWLAKTQYNASIFPAHSKELYPRYFSLAACLQWHVISLIWCFQMLPCLNYHELLALFVLARQPACCWM